ncbi:MAG: D-2-hydroxyacid dehydrogenase, partial [Spirochaetaceae bacterium]|nr:D-2-hydroxyacid dehydrogenase [Spirochaetaceae bacterium]
MKIVVLDGYALNPGDISWSPVEALGDLTVYERTAPEQVVERIGDASIILTNKTIISKEVMENCPNLKYVGVLATGYNVVDLEVARQKNIIVTNVPGYSSQAVAQFVFA